MTKVIYSCNCGDTDKFAKDAFRILFPDTDLPEIVQFATTNNPELNRYMEAIKKSHEKFAYYISYDNEVFEMWDLLKGVRVK